MSRLTFCCRVFCRSCWCCCCRCCFCWSSWDFFVWFVCCSFIACDLTGSFSQNGRRWKTYEATSLMYDIVVKQMNVSLSVCPFIHPFVCTCIQQNETKSSRDQWLKLSDRSMGRQVNSGSTFSECCWCCFPSATTFFFLVQQHLTTLQCRLDGYANRLQFTKLCKPKSQKHTKHQQQQQRQRQHCVGWGSMVDGSVESMLLLLLFDCCCRDLK